MNTPRKFRVWDGEEMHEPPHEYIWDPRDGARRVIDASDGRVTCSQPIDGEVLWATGLTDAEDTEIWEGDLVALKGPLKGYIDDLRFENEEYGRDHDLAYPPGPVRWIDGRWYLDDLPLIKELKDCETRVVGDKYRDPNLQVTAEVFA